MFQVVLAFVSFFVISVGGTIIGVIWGIATSFVTRFTEHVRGISLIFISSSSCLKSSKAILLFLTRQDFEKNISFS